VFWGGGRAERSVPATQLRDSAGPVASSMPNCEACWTIFSWRAFCFSGSSIADSQE
jgi:hypothetical protein